MTLYSSNPGPLERPLYKLHELTPLDKKPTKVNQSNATPTHPVQTSDQNGKETSILEQRLMHGIMGLDPTVQHIPRTTTTNAKPILPHDLPFGISRLD